MIGRPSQTGEATGPELRLEPTNQKDVRSCTHCGDDSRMVSGFIHHGNGPTRAAYFVHWALGVSEHPANFDLILGAWGDGASPAQRVAISLLYRNDEEEPCSFTVIDAQGRPVDTPELAGRALSRGEVIGTPLADEVFTLVDFILLNDSRIGTIESKPPRPIWYRRILGFFSRGRSDS